MRTGDKVIFIPAAWVGRRGAEAGGGYEIPRRVMGTVVEIHLSHRWCRVAYAVPSGVAYEGFKIIKRSGGRGNENSGNY